MEWVQQKWTNLKAHSLHGRLNRARFGGWGIGYNVLLGVVAAILGVSVSSGRYRHSFDSSGPDPVDEP